MGHRLRYADFLLSPDGVAPIFLEVKPEPEGRWQDCPRIHWAFHRFQEAGIGDAMLVTGFNPGWMQWFY